MTVLSPNCHLAIQTQTQMQTEPEAHRIHQRNMLSIQIIVLKETFHLFIYCQTDVTDVIGPLSHMTKLSPINQCNQLAHKVT